MLGMEEDRRHNTTPENAQGLQDNLLHLLIWSGELSNQDDHNLRRESTLSGTSCYPMPECHNAADLSGVVVCVLCVHQWNDETNGFQECSQALSTVFANAWVPKTLSIASPNFNLEYHTFKEVSTHTQVKSINHKVFCTKLLSRNPSTMVVAPYRRPQCHKASQPGSWSTNESQAERSLSRPRLSQCCQGQSCNGSHLLLLILPQNSKSEPGTNFHKPMSSAKPLQFQTISLTCWTCPEDHGQWCLPSASDVAKRQLPGWWPWLKVQSPEPTPQLYVPFSIHFNPFSIISSHQLFLRFYHICSRREGLVARCSK